MAKTAIQRYHSLLVGILIGALFVAAGTASYLVCTKLLDKNNKEFQTITINNDVEYNEVVNYELTLSPGYSTEQKFLINPEVSIPIDFSFNFSAENTSYFNFITVEVNFDNNHIDTATLKDLVEKKKSYSFKLSNKKERQLIFTYSLDDSFETQGVDWDFSINIDAKGVLT